MAASTGKEVKNIVVYVCFYVTCTIEIINNTRGGIVMFIQTKKGNASDEGQKIQMLK